MAVDFDAVFRQGGHSLVDLLEFCVISVQMDPVFLFLAGEYRIQPSGCKAIALYDLFCAPGAPTRISAHHLVPPRNLRIAQLIEQLRLQERPPETEPAEQSSEAEGQRAFISIAAASYVFDEIAEGLRRSASGPLRSLAQQYNPQRRPRENLPHGKMTQGQRAFVDYTWQPLVRPRLVAAGFRRIANVG